MDEIDIRSQGIAQGVFLIRNAGPLHRKYHRIYLRLLPGKNGFLCWAYDGYHDGVSIYASVYDYRNLFWFHGNQNVLAIGIPVIPGFYRIARSETLSIRERTFVMASKTMGAGSRYTIFKHIIPNALPQIFITLSGTIGGCIMAESSLGFLGLGIAPPTPSWGMIINEGKDVFIDAPWVAIFGGLMITLTTLAFNLLGTV